MLNIEVILRLPIKSKKNKMFRLLYSYYKMYISSNSGNLSAFFYEHIFIVDEPGKKVRTRIFKPLKPLPVEK